MKKLFLFVFILSLTAEAQKRRPHQTESVGAVDKAPSIVAVRIKAIAQDSSNYKVFAELEVSDVAPTASVLDAFINQFRVGWYITPEYNSKEKIGIGNVLLTDEYIKEENRRLYLKFEIKRTKPASTGVLFMEFVDNLSKKKFTTDAPLRFENQKLRDQFAIFVDEKVNFNNFVSTNQRFMVSNPGMPSEPLFMIQYDHQFDQAQPPMTTTPRSASKEMKINVVRQIQTNKLISFAEEGLYYVVRDTAKLDNGIAIVGVDDRFPRLTNVEQVVKPLTYVSSSKEVSKIAEAEDKKLALDAYLLQVMHGDQEKAKSFMRFYFSNIEEANRLFTTYKEGWKTDKGMIFSVLGPPSRIQRSRDREVWSYSQNVGSSDMIFNFVKRPNQFSDNHYELVRYPEYQALWYEKIDEWRKKL